MTMQESMAKLKELCDKLENKRDKLTEQVENLQAQLESVSETLEELTGKVDALESITLYEADDVIQAIERLDKEVADKFPAENVVDISSYTPFSAEFQFSQKAVLCVKTYVAETSSYNGSGVTRTAHRYQSGKKYIADHWRPGYCHIDGFYIGKEDWENFVEI